MLVRHMAKDTLLALLSAMQVEASILILFVIVFGLRLRSRPSKPWQGRFFLGLVAIMFITFLAFIYVAYINGMISDSGRALQRQSSPPIYESIKHHDKYRTPNWFIAILVAAIAIWRVKSLLKYRKDPELFITEITDNTTDKKKLSFATNYYIIRESYLCGSLSLFAAISYIKALGPYLWPIALTILSGYLCAFVIGEILFRNRKYASK